MACRVKSTEYTKGHEVMQEDRTSDHSTEVTVDQGTFITGTGGVKEHRSEVKHKNTVVNVSEDTLILRIETYGLHTTALQFH